MAKQVHTGIDGLRINETEVQVLAYLVKLSCNVTIQDSQDREFVAVGRRQVAEELDCSISTVVRSCRALERDGLLESRLRTHDNGAQMPNVYRATEFGLEVLRILEEKHENEQRENEQNQG